MGATLVWFRQDLRLQDNPALAAAVKRGGPVVPVFILEEDAPWAPGGASRWWLHHSLAALDEALRERKLRLVLAKGDAAEELGRIRRAAGTDAVYWNRCYEPAAIKRDKAIKAALADEGLEVKSFNAAVLFEPHTVQNKSGGPFQVFTPFWKHCLTLDVEEPGRCPTGAWPAPGRWPAGVALDDLGLKPKIPWDEGFGKVWTPGEAGAQRRLKAFVGGAMDDYAARRNEPGVEGTSGLSPHLHWGDLGPRQIWAAVKARSKDSGVFPVNRGAQVFLSEVGWREFAYHLLFHFPHTPEKPLREDFAKFPWRKDARQRRAWQKGLTGYPIVDAGMRQLWTTGWMHNRVRMIAGSFLVKDLRIAWQEGAAWFWDTLVDADLASNTLGWQWIGGCGADAAPYYRIFNPILQGRKFDPEGAYVRRWVPELAKVPDKFIHNPWEASTEDLARAGVRLGMDYPRPVVDHGEARRSALQALKSIRQSRP